MSKKNEVALVLGGVPRADLLPAEIKNEANIRARRRLMGLAVVLVTVLVIAGYALVTVGEQAAQSRLAEANDRTADLVAQQAEFAEGQAIVRKVEETKQAQQTAAATQIDWGAFRAQLSKVVRADVYLLSVSGEARTPFEDIEQSEVPALEATRTATVTMTIAGATVAELSEALAQFEKLDGYLDATPTGIATSDKIEGLGFGMTVVMHFDDSILVNKPVATEEIKEEGE